jgi:hypothetical protein
MSLLRQCCCGGCPPEWTTTTHYVRVTYYVRVCQYSNSGCTSYSGGSPGVYEAVGTLDGTDCQSSLSVRYWHRSIATSCADIFGSTTSWSSDTTWAITYDNGTWLVATPAQIEVAGDETGGCAVLEDTACQYIASQNYYESRRVCMTIEVATTPFTLSAKTLTPTIATDCSSLP